MVLGAAIGPFLGLLLMQQYSIEVIFGLNLGLSFISLILAIFMKVPFETIARTAEDKGFKVSVLSRKKPFQLPLSCL